MKLLAKWLTGLAVTYFHKKVHLKFLTGLLNTSVYTRNPLTVFFLKKLLLLHPFNPVRVSVFKENEKDVILLSLLLTLNMLLNIFLVDIEKNSSTAKFKSNAVFSNLSETKKIMKKLLESFDELSQINWSCISGERRVQGLFQPDISLVNVVIDVLLVSLLILKRFYQHIVLVLAGIRIFRGQIK